MLTLSYLFFTTPAFAAPALTSTSASSANSHPPAFANVPVVDALGATASGAAASALAASDLSALNKNALGKIVFGDERAAAAQAPITQAPRLFVATAMSVVTPMFVATPVLNAPDASLVETWRADSINVSGQRGALHYRYNQQLLFGCITLPETSFASADITAAEVIDGTDKEIDGADKVVNATGKNANDVIEAPQHSALHRATASAYQQIFALLDELALPYLWRVWNFIPQINAESHGLERYRQFNIARQTAFAASGRAVIGNVPAASALGSAGGALTIYFFAGGNAPRAIENPRQLSAYHYPSTYGPRSPVFARASAIELNDTELLFVSGTASIVGHRTLHEGDVGAQTVESLANIDAVLAAANEKTQRRRFARRDLAYKVYIRHAADLAAVRGAVETWLGGPAPVVYLQADICRIELLVEIEASAGHAIQILTEPPAEISVA